MAAPTIPPGGTLLDTFKRSFTDVPIDAEKENAVSTSEFLDAAESLTTIFGTCPASLEFAWDSISPDDLTQPCRCPGLRGFLPCQERHDGQHQGTHCYHPSLALHPYKPALLTTNCHCTETPRAPTSCPGRLGDHTGAGQERAQGQEARRHGGSALAHTVRNQPANRPTNQPNLHPVETYTPSLPPHCLTTRHQLNPYVCTAASSSHAPR